MENRNAVTGLTPRVPSDLALTSLGDWEVRFDLLCICLGSLRVGLWKPVYHADESLHIRVSPPDSFQDFFMPL